MYKNIEDFSVINTDDLIELKSWKQEVLEALDKLGIFDKDVHTEALYAVMALCNWQPRRSAQVDLPGNVQAIMSAAVNSEEINPWKGWVLEALEGDNINCTELSSDPFEAVRTLCTTAKFNDLHESLNNDKINTWKGAIIDALVVDGIYTRDHENNPRKAILDLIHWEGATALDPKVSKAAQQLQDTYKDKYEALLKDAKYLYMQKLYDRKELFPNTDQENVMRRGYPAIAAALDERVG